MTKQFVILVKMEPNLLISFVLVASTLVSKLIVVLLKLEELTKRLPLLVLMDLEKDVQNIIQWDVALLNGEQSLKLINAVLLILQLVRLLILLLVMDLSVKKTDLCQSLSLKFFKMEITILMCALRFQRKFSLPLCNNYGLRNY